MPVVQNHMLLTADAAHMQSRQVVPLLVDAKRTLDVKMALSHGAIHSYPQRALDDYIYWRRVQRGREQLSELGVFLYGKSLGNFLTLL